MTRQKIEYKVHLTEHIPVTGGAFDVAQWLNELGQDGWDLNEIVQGVAESGMVTSDGKPVQKIVMQALCKRPLLEEDPTSVEEDKLPAVLTA